MRWKGWPSGRRARAAVAAGCALIALPAGYALLTVWARSQQPSAVASTPAHVPVFCSLPAVIAAEDTVAPLDLAATAMHVTIPAGEPAIVARVNGQPITAQMLEARVALEIKLHQQAAASLRGTPTAVEPELLMTPDQVRAEQLNKMIAETLLWQDAQRLGLVPSLADAQAEARRELNMVVGLPATDPARVQFEAYLCANSLTEATFTTDARVLRGYQDALAVGAARRQECAGVSRGQPTATGTVRADDPCLPLLRQHGQVEVYIPLH